MLILKKLKNYFLAGLVAVLPLWITFLIGRALVRILIYIPTDLAKPFLTYFPEIADHPMLLNLASLILTISFVIFLGILLTNVLVRRIFFGLEKLFEKIPLLSWIYTAIRKLTTLFYDDNKESRFKRVVMIEYPRKGIHVIGFVTTDCQAELSSKAGKKMVNVFLPTTPNPTSGFLLMVPTTDVVPLDMSTEEAVKLIVSGGVASPERSAS